METQVASHDPIIDDKDDLKPLFIFLFVVFVVWLVLSLLLPHLLNKNNASQAVGDSFNGINALFSGFAFSGIIYTILLQRKELALQRKELKDTREELRRTAAAQENSEIALRRQANNLKISAKLSALNTMVVYYNDQLINNRSALTLQEKAEMSNKHKVYLQEIEEIISRKDLGI